MQPERPFAIQGAKIVVLANDAMFADLTGGVLDTNKYTPWLQIAQELAADGVDTVTLMVSPGVLRNYTDNAFDPALDYNPSMAAVRGLVSVLQGLGLDVAISTFVHIANVTTGDGSQGTGDRPRPTDKALWQSNFCASILQWARFAQEVGATAFIPFNDETQHLLADTALTAGWLGLIGDIREVFTGHLTSGWWTDGSGNAIRAMPSVIIAQLDSLGLGFFPNLTNNASASLTELEAAYRADRDGNDLIAMLQDLSASSGKPIWITDKAFHSFDGAAADEARIFDNAIPLTPDPEEQALLYDSFLQAMTDYNSGWLLGVSFQNFNNMRDDLGEVARSMDGPLSESPQNKPAENIMAAWFLGQRQGEGIAVSDGFRSSTISGGYHDDTITGGAGRDTMIGMQGNDVFYASAPAQPATGYQITLSMRGVQTSGIAPIVTVRDAAGIAVTTATVTAALDPSQSTQTGPAYALSFEVETKSGFSLEMNNWTFVDFTAMGNRFVRIESAKINGKAVILGNSNMTYAWSGGSQAGGTDSVHGGGFRFDFSSVNVNAVPLTVDSDDDWIEGGAGIDTVVYASSFAHYKLYGNATTYHVEGTSSEGHDTLLDVERIHFSDRSIAIDIDGHAGLVARTLGAVFGSASIANPTYVGIGLGLLDSGMAYEALLTFALQAALGPSASHTAIVDLLYTNVVGEHPDAATQESFVQMLDSGTFTVGSLAAMAANTALNEAQIDLVGLAQTGLAYV